jgi:hypothetical protein
MARVFTINFEYKGKVRSALVSFGPEDTDMTFLVRYLDEDLNELIPGRKIIVSLSEGVKSPKNINRLAEDLLNHTTEAISNYLYHYHE